MGDAQIIVRVSDDDLAPEQLDEISGGLRRELLELDVEEVRPVVAGEAPEGTRGLDIVAIGAWIVTIQNASVLVERLVGVVRSWMAPAPESRTVEITIGGNSLTLGNANAEDQRMLIAEFVSAVKTDQGAGGDTNPVG